MTWWDVESLARAGIAVRRSAWPATKTLVFAGSTGSGGARAVACIVADTGLRVVSNAEFGATEFEATDWRQA